MKKGTFIAALLGIYLATGFTLQAADQTIKLFARSGSKMRIEGTSLIHDWQVESKLIGGWLETSANFPITPGQEVKPGKMDVHGVAKITVRSLQSVEKNGSHYSDKMDESMWKKLKVNEFTNIYYYPGELSLKESPKTKDAPYMFESKGDVVVAGVTNTVSMPVNVIPMADNKVKISGTLNTKFSNFKLDPTFPVIGGATFKTADEVKLIWDWVVGANKTVGASASK
jgi:hypothetical protein